MDSKLIGSILLVVGTTVGAGMLGLPIATAELGFFGAVILLIGCWLFMMCGAFLLLEVNLWLPQNNNLITMAKKTIGPIGQLIAWITYLLLLYSLLSAYIAGGSDLFHQLLLNVGVTFSKTTDAIIFTLFFSSIVYLGIRSIDYTNRGLMILKFSAYFLLIIFLAPFISLPHLQGGNWADLTGSVALTVTITSFGYAAIIPSLRIYFAGDIKRLKLAIIIGSIIPLFCYIAWDAALMGVASLQSVHSASELVTTLTQTVNHSTITFFAKLFTSVCVLTSFLGVSLCLTDFWADGLQLEKQGKNKIVLHLLTFVPPLGVVLFFPNVFVKALQYAGLYCIVLLVLLPAWMAFQGRYRHQFAGDFKVWGGKTLLVFLIVLSFILIARGLIV